MNYSRSKRGMLGFVATNQSVILNALIKDLHPAIAAVSLPGLPAYVIFLCIRYVDYLNDEVAVKSFFNCLIIKIYFHTKRHQNSLEVLVLWLANVCRLLHIMKQFSGEKEFQSTNSREQNEESLVNFDLREYREVLSDLAVRIFHYIVNFTESEIQPLIDPALVEEVPSLISCIKHGNRRRSSMFVREIKGALENPPKLCALLNILSSYDDAVTRHCIDPQLRNQLFQQLLRFINSLALSCLLHQPNVCNWEGALRIRYNVNQLEKWAQDRRLDAVAEPSLQPIVQATQLILTRKTMDDVDNVCSLSNQLTTAQVLQILNLHSPAESAERKSSQEFIDKIRDKLEKERGIEGKQDIYYEKNNQIPVIIPYNPSSIVLHEIIVPTEFCVNSILHPI